MEGLRTLIEGLRKLTEGLLGNPWDVSKKLTFCSAAWGGGAAPPRTPYGPLLRPGDHLLFFIANQ